MFFVARNAVSAVNACLNALTALDRTQGTTLETWEIEMDVAVEGNATP